MKNMARKRVRLPLPAYIENICSVLEEAGYAAYAVGGAVRDFLLGREPHDYDVATAAQPFEALRLFPHTVATGLAHGTVTVVVQEGNVEVTTFRSDGAYHDMRRPDSVQFLSSVEEDLARRDFTVNAMAYSPRRGFCDPFGGKADAENKILRTVGNPKKRFEEDVLRVLRMYRFSAQLSFSIEAETEMAAREMAHFLLRISRERIFAELEKLLFYADGAHLANAISALGCILPDTNREPEKLERVAACLSMAGKWATLCGENTIKTLRALKAPRHLILSAGELAAYRYSGNIIADVATLKHTSPADFFAYLQNEEQEKNWKTARAEGVPVHMRQLALSGDDLIKIGFAGPEIGAALKSLFLYVIENPGNNNKEKLKEVAEWLYSEK